MIINYIIRFVGSDIITDYDGMNHYAAKGIGFDSPIAENEILVNENLSFIDEVHTIIHEIIEAEAMKKGALYFPSHRRANRSEEIPENIAVVSKALQEMLDRKYGYDYVD